MRFTPSNSEQRLRPPSYRGCWHGVSRRFLWRYRQSGTLFEYPGFFPPDSGLHPERLPPTRGVAASVFRPLRNIPHCCLPLESGPYLSPNVADRPLRPATRHRLGEPLPHQQADTTRPPHQARACKQRPPLVSFTCEKKTLCGISPGFPRLSLT